MNPREAAEKLIKDNSPFLLKNAHRDEEANSLFCGDRVIETGRKRPFPERLGMEEVRNSG